MSPYALLHIQINIVQLGVQWHNFFYFKSLTKISDPGLVDWPWSCCGPLTPWSPAPPVHQPTGTFIQVIILANLLKATDFNFKCGSGTRKFNTKPVRALNTVPVRSYRTAIKFQMPDWYIFFFYASGTKLKIYIRYKFFKYTSGTNFKYTFGTEFKTRIRYLILNIHPVQS